MIIVMVRLMKAVYALAVLMLMVTGSIMKEDSAVLLIVMILM